MRDNMEGKVMMWFDYGNYVEAVGLEPFVKNPSKSIKDRVATCFQRNESECDRLVDWESDEKIRLSATFFVTEDIEDALCIAYDNDIDYVFIDPSMVAKFAAIAMSYDELNGLPPREAPCLETSPDYADRIFLECSEDGVKDMRVEQDGDDENLCLFGNGLGTKVFTKKGFMSFFGQLYYLLVSYYRYKPT